ncbi:hypothetical protein KJ656_06235, partial [bacterium]|nr:hypothetical protein [bacterium]
QVSENHQIRREFIDIIRKRYETLRRVPLKYEELKSETIRKFIERNNGAQRVFSIDRMDPDSWFFNDNYITFLTLQAKRIKESSTKNPYEAHRILIWRKDLYNDSRNKQIIMMNSYAGVKTYLIPSEFIERRMNQLPEYLNKKSIDLSILPQKMRMKDDWLKWLIKREEFLLVERDTTIIGMGKKEEAGVITDEDLGEIEGKVYKYFFDWLIEFTSGDDKIISLVNLDNISAVDSFFLERVETKITEIIEELMKRD